MHLLYFLSLIILYLEIVFVKKTNSKQNIIVGLVYSFCIIFFYHLIAGSVLSVLDVKNNLFGFSIICLITVICIYFISKYRNKKFITQKYYFDKKHLVYLLVIFIICFCIGIIRFYPNFKSINYLINDSATHYRMAYDYSVYHKLLDSNYNGPLNYNNSMFGFYIPCGLFMELMPFPKIVSYNLFNTLIFCLISICFYITLLTLKKKNGFFSLFLTLLYMFAYPLNYMIFGFGYLGVGILATNLIIITFKLFSKYDNISFYLLMSIFNFGLFVSYYLFVPVVYLSELVYLIYYSFQKKYKIKKSLKTLLCIIIPMVFGMTYHIFPTTILGNIYAYSLDGYSYQSLFSNFVLLAPMVCYSIYMQAKNNKFDFELCLILFLILYIVLTFMLIGNGYVSSYYFYKPYYILWLIVNIFIYKLSNYSNCIPYMKIHYFLVIIALLLSFIDVEKKVSEKDQMFEYSGIFNKLSDIYIFNKDKMYRNENKISEEKIEIIKKSTEKTECKLNVKNNILPYVTSRYDKWWFYMINNIKPVENNNSKKYNYYNDEIDFNFINENDNIKCVLVDKKKIKEFEKNNISDKYDILFENKSGKLYKKKM